MPELTKQQIWKYIRDRAEVEDGAVVCKAPLSDLYRAHGFESFATHRSMRVKELEGDGLVHRPNRYNPLLIILDPKVRPGRKRRGAHR